MQPLDITINVYLNQIFNENTLINLPKGMKKITIKACKLSISTATIEDNLSAIGNNEYESSCYTCMTNKEVVR